MLETAFVRDGEQFRVRDELRAGVEFHRQDIREVMPEGPFDLVLCRNLAFTYFDEDGQREVLRGIDERLVAGGYLVVGAHESLPGGVPDLVFVPHPTGSGGEPDGGSPQIPKPDPPDSPRWDAAHPPRSVHEPVRPPGARRTARARPRWAASWARSSSSHSGLRPISEYLRATPSRAICPTSYSGRYCPMMLT